MNRKWDIKDEATRKKCIDEIITRIEEIDGDKVGVIAAQDIIDIVTEHFGPEVYNAALGDVNKLLETKFQDITTDVELLEQRVHSHSIL